MVDSCDSDGFVLIVRYRLVLQGMDELVQRMVGRAPFVLDDFQGFQHGNTRVVVGIGQLRASPMNATVTGLFD